MNKKLIVPIILFFIIIISIFSYFYFNYIEEREDQISYSLSNKNDYSQKFVLSDLPEIPNIDLRLLFENEDFLFEKGTRIDLLKARARPSEGHLNLLYSDRYCFDDELNDCVTLTQLLRENSNPIVQFNYQNKILFSAKLCSPRATDAIGNIIKIDDTIFFEIAECDETEKNHVWNIRYDSKSFNSKYNVKNSFELFSYKGKLGFITSDNDNHETIVYFDNKKITKTYSNIHAKACCSFHGLFNVYDNGALLFLASDKENNYIVEIDLNHFLDK